VPTSSSSERGGTGEDKSAHDQRAEENPTAPTLASLGKQKLHVGPDQVGLRLLENGDFTG
jgi:hypothetical protein